MTFDGRTPRSYSSRQIIIALAKHGVAIETMARALVIPATQVDAVCRRAYQSCELIAMPPTAPADVRGAIMTDLLHTRDQLEAAQQRIRELSAQSAADANSILLPGIPRSASIIASMLAKHGRCSKVRLYAALYGGRADPNDTPGPKIIDIFICKLRKKLAEHGITIKTLWGWGYEMDPADGAKLRALAAWPRETEAPAPVDPADPEAAEAA